MSELLDDLKQWADAVHPTESITDGHLKDLLGAAAAEIERLRAALWRIADDDDVCPAGHAMAREALRGCEHNVEQDGK